MTLAAKNHVNINANSRNSAKPSITKICSVYLTSRVWRCERRRAQRRICELANARHSIWLKARMHPPALGILECVGDLIRENETYLGYLGS
jgi:hypothetical protein